MVYTFGILSKKYILLFTPQRLKLFPIHQAPANEEEQRRQAEAKEVAEDQRRGMLIALLQPAARDRCE